MSAIGLAMACVLAMQAAPEPSQHWAFRPVRPVEPPVVKGTRWVTTPVDRFVLAGLEAKSLHPARPASKEQLIRRVNFGLIGLPPTPAEIDAFIDDPSPDAFAKLVDRLLASPHYGERWARHWLDLARFAESDGFEHDAVRPHSWRYRDYVIQSFNADKPYDRFVREQVAGDELWPEDRDALAATAFNLLGPDMVDSADQVQRRCNTLNDMTDTTAAVFLAQTMGCARCHDHKFEPFTQRDYYSLQAFFSPVTFQLELLIPTPAERRAYETAMAEYHTQSGATQKQLDTLEAPHRERLHQEKLSRLSEDARLAHQTAKEKRTMEQEGTVLETAPMLKITDTEVLKLLSPEEKKERNRLLDALKRIPKPAPLSMTMALQNTNGPPPKTFVLARGDYNNPREQVQAGLPAILSPLTPALSPLRGEGARRQSEAEAISLAAPDSKAPLNDLAGTRRRDTEPSNAHVATPSPLNGERAGVRGEAGQKLSTLDTGQERTALANWLASPTNPLTARVMVNRIWQHHFGRGLVPTPGDFGTRGQPPTHPELLDWLAGEFVARGWSVKAMHKLILLSVAYQQSSEPTDSALKLDPENRLFSRQNRARLEGEIIRDSLLAISGQLNRTVGGPSVFPPVPSDITKISKNWTASADLADHNRRSLYIFARRNLRFPFLEVFDAPDSNLTCPERGRSTTAPQALTLVNSEEVMAAANATAARLLKEAKKDDERIELAFRLALGRRANGKELKIAREFLETCRSPRKEAHYKLETRNSERGIDQSLLTSAAWTELCRALFNLNSFVYVD
jgi:hypothetical protein